MLVLLLVGLSACRPRETELPIKTIGRYPFGQNGGLYMDREPTLVAITQAFEVAMLDDWIFEDPQEQLLKLDYDAYFAIVVFQGLKPGGGFGVQIDKVTRNENVVTAFAQFAEPAPGMETTAAEESPYHVVRVNKAGSWSQDITINLVVDEVVIATTTNYIP